MYRTCFASSTQRRRLSTEIFFGILYGTGRSSVLADFCLQTLLQ